MGRHDVMTKAQRSALMSRIRSTGTRIERIMEESLRKDGLTYVPHPAIFGRPDFLISDRKIAIFCDGDFWHGYNFGRNSRHDVRDHRAFWIAKIKRNIKRDKLVNRKLREEGWTVLRFWEHEIKGNPEACVRRIVALMT